MTVKTFTARDMNDALRLVRQQLGPDALITQSRIQPRSGLWRWLGRGRRIEVTATDQPSPSGGSADVTRRQSAATPSRSSTPAPASAAGSKTPADRRRRQPRPGKARAARPPADDLRQQLLGLQAVVQRLSDQDGMPAGGPPSGPLGWLAAELAAAEVPHRFAERLLADLCAVQPEGEAIPTQDQDSLREQLVQQLARRLPTCGGIQLTAGQRRVVALVGPAGVGKTTMLAKLAAEFQLRRKQRVGLITTDNFRIAAVDQLRTFADIIDAPLHVVTTPREMRTAIEQLHACSVVLIDTPGRSPHDTVQLQELRSILAEGHPEEVHLVQSSAAAAGHWRQCFQHFAPLRLTALILTKLDETVPAGHLLPILSTAPLPLSYISQGQQVPDDLQRAEPLTLAGRLLAPPPR